MKLRQILIGLLLAAVFLAGCTAGVKTIYAEDYFVKVTDDLGREVTIKEKPQQIVSLASSHTETLFALGAGNR